MQACPVFVINLPRDSERRAHMERQLAALGMAAEFVPAVDGRGLSAADRAAYDPVRALKIYGVAMMDAEIGCYLSHYRLYERMLRENIGVALILEDDVDLDPALPAIVEEIAAEANPPWLAVRLESLRGRVLHPKKAGDYGHEVKKLSGGAAVFRLDTHVLGFGGYIVTQAGARRMCDYGRRIFMPIDQTMDRFWENGLAPYIVRPLPVRQRQDIFASRIGARPSGRQKGQKLWVRLWKRWQRTSDGIKKRWFVLTH